MEQSSSNRRGSTRTVHTVTFGGRRRGRPVFFGVMMVGLGLLFLLDNLNLVEARYFFRNFWPLLLVAWGLSRVLYGRGGERTFGAIAAAFGGLILGDRLLGWNINFVGLFWPLVLIAIGLNALLRPRHRASVAPPTPPIPPGPPIPPDVPTATVGGATEGEEDTDRASSLREVAIMAGIERRNVSQTFRGGTITAVMGGVEVDLRDCRMAEDSANIWIQAILGHVVLRLPSDWTVESRLTAVMGNVEDQSDRPVESSPKRLLLEGSAFMGHVEIRN
jgi:predicted membrane protein